MIVQFPPAHFNQHLSKVILTTISKASFLSVTLNHRTQKIRRKLEEDALSESRGDFLPPTNLIVSDVLQISVLMWDIIPLSPVSTDWLMVPAITGILWIMGMLLSAPLKESRYVLDDLKENVRMNFPSTRWQINARLSGGVLITIELPGHTTAHVSPTRLFFLCIYRCCFSPVARAGH